VTYINQEMLDHNSYIWRGQRRDDWKLETTLSRLMKKVQNPFMFQEEHLEQFKEASRGRRGANPAILESDHEWWALGQHHGLATPLLDWTVSPFAAAFFAFHELAPNPTKYRVVYALHRDSIEDKVRELVKEGTAKNLAAGAPAKSDEGRMTNVLVNALRKRRETPEIEFVRPRSDENQRLLAQGGLFTRGPTSKSLDRWVQEHFAGKSHYHLTRMLIPDSDREEALRMLNRMNLNHATLFPDLTGASKLHYGM
jgi:hypothetical protein